MFRSAIIALALVAQAPTSQSATVTAETFIAETTNEAVAGGGQALAELVMDRLDVGTIARFTLGRYARSLPASELGRFETALEVFLFNQLSGNANMLDGAEIEIVGSVERRPGDVIVTSRVRLDSSETQTIRWRTLDRGEGWRIVDVEVAGLWLAVEQRAQFAAILSRRDATIDDLIASLGGVQLAAAGS